MREDANVFFVLRMLLDRLEDDAQASRQPALALNGSRADVARSGVRAAEIMLLTGWFFGARFPDVSLRDRATQAAALRNILGSLDSGHDRTSGYQLDVAQRQVGTTPLLTLV